MLALKQSLSLVTSKLFGGWSPLDEGSLLAWYKYETGVFRTGASVYLWEDSSLNSNDMEQTTEDNRPQLNASSGALDFTASNVSFLQSAEQITLSGAFTIAFRIIATSFNVTIIGDNTTSQEYIKLTSTTNLRLTIDGSNVNLENSGGFGTNNIIITRDGDNNVKLYVDGSLTDTQHLEGDSDIDALGVRATNLNSFDGSMYEVQIYSSTSAALNTNINNRLSNL